MVAHRLHLDRQRVQRVHPHDRSRARRRPRAFRRVFGGVHRLRHRRRLHVLRRHGVRRRRAAHLGYVDRVAWKGRRALPDQPHHRHLAHRLVRRAGGRMRRVVLHHGRRPGRVRDSRLGFVGVLGRAHARDRRCRVRRREVGELRRRAASVHHLRIRPCRVAVWFRHRFAVQLRARRGYRPGVRHQHRCRPLRRRWCHGRRLHALRPRPQGQRAVQHHRRASPPT